jgi:hypothetical protein
MCKHQPPCPDALASDGMAARVMVTHPEQGWSLLCNGVVLFDDAGVLLPSGQEVGPRPVVPASRRPARPVSPSVLPPCVAAPTAVRALATAA